MPDSSQITSNPQAQTANAQGVLPDGGVEGNCPLWDGHVVDATIPPVSTSSQSLPWVHPVSLP
jgi:hypothetical protein